MKLFQSLALNTVVGLSLLNAANYNVDASHSDVGFKIKQFSAINGTVETASINAKNDKLNDNLRGLDFFDVEKYPKMSLKLLKHDGDKATFELTIKDVTKVVTLEVDDISSTIKDPWGNTRMGFELEGEITLACL